MKNFLKNIIDFFNSDSPRNIDKNLSYYKKEATNYKLDISHLKDLELSINNTTDENHKHELKVKLKNEIESLVFHSPEGQSDRAW